MRHLTRELLGQSTGATSEFRIFTLDQLAASILQTAFANVRIVEEPVLTLLFDQAITSSEHSLAYFKQPDKQLHIPKGTFERIIAVVRKLKEVGVYPDALAEEIPLDAQEEQSKLRDVVTIYSEYEKVLATLKGVDAEGIFKTLHLDCPQKSFADAFRNLFPGAQEIAIVGFDEFTEPELGFIQKLCGLNIAVSLVFDFQQGNHALFGHLEQNYQRFRDLGFSPVSSPPAIFPGQQKRLSTDATRHIASNLFTRSGGVEKPNLSKLITIAKAKDRVREIELICKFIKQLAVEQLSGEQLAVEQLAVEQPAAHDPLRDLTKICVAFYRPQLYTHIVREQFAKFGIPVNVTDRYELAQSPVVVSVIGLLEVAVRNFRRDDVVRVLSSSYFDFRNEGKRVNRANLATVSLDLRITAGAQSWRRKIAAQIERIGHQKLMSMDDEANTRRARDVEKLKRAKSDIGWLEGLLLDIGRDRTPREFHTTLHLLLSSLEVSRCIVSGAHRDLIEKDARAYAKLLEVVEQLTRLLEYQEGKSKKHPLKFYIEQLKVALSQERYNVREQFGEGVLVTSIDETRGLPMNVMILAGLVDGEFPSDYQSEIFFSAQRLKEREQHHKWENRYLFYQAITNWSEHLYLTYPEQDADLDLVPSSFIDALKNICEVEEWTYPGNAPVESVMHSQEEYLRERGKLRKKAKLPVPEALKQKVRFIEHAIRVDRSRAEMGDLPEYQGGIFSAVSHDAKEQLQLLRHRVYSVSQLETYGKCPFQFFARRLLRLNAMQDLEEEFSPLEKGSVVHEALFEFYTLRREKNLPPLINCSEEEFAEAHRLLLEIAERKLSEIDIPDAFWDLEKELILGDKNSGKGLLREFLDHERRRKTSYHAEYFEVGFGSELGEQTRIDKRFSSEEPVAAGAVLLRGKVDRVEIGDESFAIIDYKTGGNIAKIEDVREGVSLQLPIYLYTIEKLLAEKKGKELQPAAGLYYQIRNKIDLKTGVGSSRYKDELGIKSKSGFLPSDEELRRLIDDSVERVNTYVNDITEGKFPLTSHDKIDKVCTYCDYKTICRIQNVRRVGKAQEDSP